MKEKFTVEFKSKTYLFKLNKEDGYVWLIESDNSMSNHFQIEPAQNLESAKRIAKLMLAGLGK
jgi:hypothetical protein